MKVKDLIKMLERQDKDANVIFTLYGVIGTAKDSGKCYDLRNNGDSYVVFETDGMPLIIKDKEHETVEIFNTCERREC